MKSKNLVKMKQFKIRCWILQACSSAGDSKKSKRKIPCEISRNFLESVSLNNPTELLTNNTSSKNKSNWTFNLEDRQKIFSYLTYCSLWWGLTRSLNLHLDTETLICTNMGFYWLLGIMLYAAQRVSILKMQKKCKKFVKTIFTK